MRHKEILLKSGISIGRTNFIRSIFVRTESISQHIGMREQREAGGGRTGKETTLGSTSDRL